MNEVVRAELLLLREQSDGNELVFRSPKTGGKLVDIKKGFKAACKAADIQEFRFHDLRHTTGTRLGDVGTVATTIAEILGHSDLRMTKRYTQVTGPEQAAGSRCTRHLWTWKRRLAKNCQNFRKETGLIKDG